MDPKYVARPFSLYQDRDKPLNWKMIQLVFDMDLGSLRELLPSMAPSFSLCLSVFECMEHYLNKIVPHPNNRQSLILTSRHFLVQQYEEEYLIKLTDLWLEPDSENMDYFRWNRMDFCFFFFFDQKSSSLLIS